MKGKQLDLTSPASLSADNAGKPSNEPSGQRSFLGVHFACCEVYSRVYLNCAKTHFLGNCPHCAKQVRFQVGPGGTEARFFTAR
jgi:hypothetical protein